MKENGASDVRPPGPDLRGKDATGVGEPTRPSPEAPSVSDQERAGFTWISREKIWRTFFLRIHRERNMYASMRA